MRTVEGINADVNRALALSDAAALQHLSEELDALGTTEAAALAARTKGAAAAFTGNYPVALEHLHHALELQNELGDLEGVAAVTGNIGNVFRMMADHPAALEHFRRAEQMYAKLEHLNGVALNTGNMGIVFAETGEYPAALEHYRRALTVHEELDDRVGIARVTGNMGLVFRSMGDYGAALEQYGRAMQMHQELGDRASVARVTGNMAIVSAETGDYPSALEHLRHVLRQYEDLGDRVNIARVTGNIGNVFRSTGDYPSALEQYHRALTIHEDLNDRAGKADVIGNIGNTYRSTGDFASALEHFHRALQLHEDLNDRAGVARVTGNMGLVYSDTGDYSSALEHFQHALQINEELGDRASIARLTGSMASVRLTTDDVQGAAELLDRQANMILGDPAVRADHYLNRGRLTLASDVEATREHYLHALQIAEEAGLRSTSADCHERLRDLAEKRNDFAGYIHHNREFLRISEEIRGKEATQKLTMLEAQRTIDAERQEREKERALLYGALPEPIANRMLSGEDVSGDTHENAAVLFLDVAGFTIHASSLAPQETTQLLAAIFSRFDDICDEHNVVKIKTIGDAYLCFAHTDIGEQISDIGPEERVAAVALAMQNTEFYWPTATANSNRIQFRIGIHCGPVTAGVIGTKRLQYDVWGDTVNVASRMESTGEAGRIQVSSPFATALRDGERISDTGEDGPISDHRYPTLRERGAVEIKGKGQMQTYWLE